MTFPMAFYIIFKNKKKKFLIDISDNLIRITFPSWLHLFLHFIPVPILIHLISFNSIPHCSPSEINLLHKLSCSSYREMNYLNIEEL